MQCEHPLSHFPLNELSASVGVEGFGYFKNNADANLLPG
jgi:hypothetical protein